MKSVSLYNQLEWTSEKCVLEFPDSFQIIPIGPWSPSQLFTTGEQRCSYKAGVPEQQTMERFHWPKIYRHKRENEGMIHDIFKAFKQK